jgi:hypothetical protein
LTGFQRYSINWGNGIITNTNNNSPDVLVLKYDISGDLKWAKTAGGASNDRGDAVNLNQSGQLLISGNFMNNALFDTINASGTGSLNAFYARLSNPLVTGYDEQVGIVTNHSLSQNYPNPFNSSTIIEFNIPQYRFISLDLFDINGKIIKSIYKDFIQPGNHKLKFDASELSSGIYFYRLKTDEVELSRRMILIK